MYGHSDVTTSVLRPVPALGTFVNSAIGRYLRTNPVLMPMGFNPVLQFIHEEDLTEALALSVEQGLRGVYNVTGPGEVPAKVAIRESGARVLEVPGFVLSRLIQVVYGLPPGAMDFMKFACTIDGSRFRAETGFEPLFSLKDIFRTLRALRSS